MANVVLPTERWLGVYLLVELQPVLDCAGTIEKPTSGKACPLRGCPHCCISWNLMSELQHVGFDATFIAVRYFLAQKSVVG